LGFAVISYYRRFVKGFSQLGAPLTDLTKKGAFHCTEASQSTFEKMKEVMSTCPVLALPKFSQPFVLECDASGKGIGEVLMQGGHPIVFERRKLSESRETLLYLQQRNVGYHACLDKIQTVLNRQQIRGEN
jgi:hypothetical protein